MDNNNHQTISACLVIYNEEQLISKCLDSIKDLVDEIIIVHDGECTDKTLEIARKYTDKIFVREHVMLNEVHLVFAYKQAKGEWLLRLDADEFFDIADHEKIRTTLASSPEVNGFTLDWEFWDGEKVIAFKGIQKSCFFRRKNYHFIGISQYVGEVDRGFKKVGITLHHRPKYNNAAWKENLRKAKKWVPIYAQSFFPELSTYECFNTTPEKWISYANKVTKHPVFYLVYYPLKTLLAQLKNGLCTSLVGWSIALQTYVIYSTLYWRVWQIKRKTRPVSPFVSAVKKAWKIFYKYWMKLGHALGTINGFIILSVFYFVIIGLYTVIQKIIALIFRRKKEVDKSFWKQKRELAEGLDHLKYQF